MLYLGETHGNEQKLSPIPGTRVGAEILERYKFCGHKQRYTEILHRFPVKGVDNAMSCHRTGHDRLRLAQHTHASNADALKAKKWKVTRSR